MISERVDDGLHKELAKVLALVSNPVQGILSLIRWQRQFGQTQSESESSSIQDLLRDDKSLGSKIGSFGCTVSDTERHSLVSELQDCLGPSVEQLIDSLNKIRSIHQIAPLIQKISCHANKKLEHEVDDFCDTHRKRSRVSTEDSVGRNLCCNSRNPSGTSSCGSFKPYSESALWSTQQHFYATSGAGAWERGEVPSLISSNSFVADMYVKMIVEVMLKFDRKRRVDEKKQEDFLNSEVRNRKSDGSKLRVAVVEVGAGHGLLSFLLARKFREVMHRPLSYLFDPDCCRSDSKNMEEDINNRDFSSCFDVTVIATDFHSSVFKELLLLPWTRKLCEEGLLDFAVCAASEVSHSCHLNHRGEGHPETRDAGSGIQFLYSGKQSSDYQWDILVVVANYAFDSFPTNLVASYSDGASCSQPVIFEIGVTDPRPPDSAGTSAGEPHEHGQHQPCKAERRRNKERLMARQVDVEGSPTVPKGLVDYVTAATEVTSQSEGPKSGVFAIPSAGIQIMSLLKKAFPGSCKAVADTSTDSKTSSLELGGHVSCEGPLERMTVLIVGDCVVAEDDALWQSKEFQQLCHGSNSGRQTVFPIPWFDPPLISPQPTVCAVPVSLTSLDYAFGVAFGPVKSNSGGASCGNNTSSSGSSNSNKSSGNSNCSNSGGNSICSGSGNSSDSSSTKSGPMLSYLRGCTPLCGSSFSVLVYSSPDISQTPSSSCGVELPDLENRPGCCPSVCPPFGPHDYCTIREFLLGEYRVNKRVQLNQNTVKDHTSRHGSETARPLNSMTHQKDFLPRIVAEHFSLNFLWNFIAKVGCVDSQLFTELRWVVLRAVQRLIAAARALVVTWRTAQEQSKGLDTEEEEDAVRIGPQSKPCRQIRTETEIVSEVLMEVRRWCDAAVICVRCHSCCSIVAVLQIRKRVSQWLLALCSALRKEFAPTDNDIRAAKTLSRSENNLHRSHFDDELMKGSVYALQSLLLLHGATELSEGLGLNTPQQIPESLFPNNITVPLPCCLWRCLSNNQTQTMRPALQSIIPRAVLQSSEGPQERSALLLIHCLSEEEAVCSIRALMAFVRIAAQSQTRNPEVSIDQMCSSEIILSSILPLCRHVATVIREKHANQSAAYKMDQVTLEKEKEKVIAKEKKLIRKMNRIIDLHGDALGSDAPLHNLSKLPSTLPHCP